MENNIANIDAVLKEYDAPLLITEGCMCCEATPVKAIKLLRMPPCAESKSFEDMYIGIYVCLPCKEGAYDEHKTFQNLETFLTSDVTLI